MKKFAAVVVVAILLGMVSPFMAAVDDGPFLRAWLQFLPVQADLLVLPEGEQRMLLLAMAVLADQCFIDEVAICRNSS
jgi:hypothetical protein